MQSKNKVGDEGTKEIAEGLQLNHSLKELDLVRTFFSVIFYFVVCDSTVRTNATIVMQSSNKVGDEGAMAIAASLEVNSCLKELDLVGLPCSVTLHIAMYCCRRL